MMDGIPQFPQKPQVPFQAPQEGVKLLTHCASCQKKYEPFTGHIIEEQEGAHLIHIKCKHCSASVVALVVNGGLGVTSIGFLTDLSSEDVLRLKDKKEIQIDEIIALHEELKDSKTWLKDIS